MNARVLIALSLAGVGWAQVHLAGKVTRQDGAAVAGARIILLRGSITKVALSGPDGAFLFEAAEGGVYRISVETSDYFPIQEREIRLIEGRNEITLELSDRGAVRESIEVRSQ